MLHTRVYFSRMCYQIAPRVLLSFKKYYSLLNEQKRSGVAVPVVEAIPSMKRGRPLTIGELDGVVQSYIRALREAGTPINASIVIAAANCSKDRSLLAENGGHIDLGPGWL